MQYEGKRSVVQERLDDSRVSVCLGLSGGERQTAALQALQLQGACINSVEVGRAHIIDAAQDQLAEMLAD
ncbi:MAG: hypothetical protein AAF245_16895, partial [Pseudomonadota bacterium]